MKSPNLKELAEQNPGADRKVIEEAIRIFQTAGRQETRYKLSVPFTRQSETLEQPVTKKLSYVRTRK